MLQTTLPFFFCCTLATFFTLTHIYGPVFIMRSFVFTNKKFFARVLVVSMQCIKFNQIIQICNLKKKISSGFQGFSHLFTILIYFFFFFFRLLFAICCCCSLIIIVMITLEENRQDVISNYPFMCMFGQDAT